MPPGIQHCPGQPVPCLTTLSLKKFSLVCTLNLPWHNPRPSPRALPLGTREKRQPPSFWVAVGRDEGSPQPPLLQLQPPRFLQLLLTCPFSSFADLCTCSSTSTSSTQRGAQNRARHSQHGPTGATTRGQPRAGSCWRAPGRVGSQPVTRAESPPKHSCSSAQPACWRGHVEGLMGCSPRGQPHPGTAQQARPHRAADLRPPTPLWLCSAF